MLCGRWRLLNGPFAPRWCPRLQQKPAKKAKEAEPKEEDVEIAEANALRAKLGLKPLRS